MKITDNNLEFTSTKELPKEYLILKLRVSINKDLLDNKVITYDVYDKMQKRLMVQMDKILLHCTNLQIKEE